MARPDALARHLSEVAGAWREIDGDVDAAVLGVFGRLDTLMRLWTALQREVLAPLGLNYAEAATIGILRTAQPEPRCSPTDLRQRVGQTSAGMTRILDKLEQEGLVRREYLEDDRRRVDIHLTRRGAALADASFSALYAVESRLLSPLGAQRCEAIASSFDALLEAFAARGD